MTTLWGMTPEYATAVFTFALVIVGALTGAVFLFQAALLRLQVKSMREEYISTHRPKLILRDAFCQDNELGHQISVDYVIVNVGETRAKITSSTVEVRIIRNYGFGAQSRVEAPHGVNLIGNVSINPGEGLPRMHIDKQKWGTDNDSRHAFSEPTLGVFFCGHIVYEDDLGIVRHTMFWRKYDLAESRFLRVITPVIEALDNAD